MVLTLILKHLWSKAEMMFTLQNLVVLGVIILSEYVILMVMIYFLYLQQVKTINARCYHMTVLATIWCK